MGNPAFISLKIWRDPGSTTTRVGVEVHGSVDRSGGEMTLCYRDIIVVRLLIVVCNLSLVVLINESFEEKSGKGCACSENESVVFKPGLVSWSWLYKWRLLYLLCP